MNFKKISDILPKVLAKQGVLKKSQSEEVKHVFVEVLEEVFGVGIEQNVQVKDFRDGSIYLVVSSSIWGQKIQLSSEILLEKMREKEFADINKIFSRVE